jgi:hypothetical protein
MMTATTRSPMKLFRNNMKLLAHQVQKIEPCNTGYSSDFANANMMIALATAAVPCSTVSRCDGGAKVYCRSCQSVIIIYMQL